MAKFEIITIARAEEPQNKNIDRQNRKVYIYPADRQLEILDNPETVSSNPQLPGFVLKMSKIW